MKGNIPIVFYEETMGTTLDMDRPQQVSSTSFLRMTRAQNQTLSPEEAEAHADSLLAELDVIANGFLEAEPEPDEYVVQNRQPLDERSSVIARPDTAATQKPDPVTAMLRQFVPVDCFSERSAIKVGRAGVVASLVGSVAVIGGMFAAASVAAPVTVAAIGWWFVGSSSAVAFSGYSLIEAGRVFRYRCLGTV